MLDTLWLSFKVEDRFGITTWLLSVDFCLRSAESNNPVAYSCVEGCFGSVLSGHYARPATPLPDVPANAVMPFIHGRAFVTLDANLVFDPADAFAWGLA